MDKVDETPHDINNPYNLTTSLATSLSYHQLILHIRSVLASLQDSLFYIRTVYMHTMDYIDAATTGTLLPHVLPIMDLKKMLAHIEETLPLTLHLPVSSEDTLHFYRYLCTDVLNTSKQFYSSYMYLFRIDHSNFQYTKFSPWTSHMETSQHDMTSTLNILASLRMKQWQWRCHLISSVFVWKPMDNFVMSLPLFNHLQIYHPASQLYTPGMHAAF